MLLRGPSATTCNAALPDKLLALNQCRFMDPDPLSIGRRKAVVCSNKNINAPVLAVSVGEPKQQQQSGLAEKTFADRLRMGSLEEDGLSYKEKFIVRCYEVGINKTATVETIANLLQLLVTHVYSVNGRPLIL